MTISNPKASEAEPVFASSILLGNTMGDRVLAHKLLDLYLADLQSRAAVLRVAALEGNTGLMRQQAHALKGASFAVGAQQLASLAQRMEAACRQSPAPCVLEGLQGFEKLVMATQAQMQSWMVEAPPRSTP
ncbi:MAG: Hpt domain-containing protein [Kiritimatiellaeota bacterium]|nr:Hpt domain-containing protein [Kiritimatiellota bacterium]